MGGNLLLCATRGKIYDVEYLWAEFIVLSDTNLIATKPCG